MSQSSVVDPRYYSDGKSWEESKHRDLQAKVWLWRSVALGAFVGMMGGLGVAYDALSRSKAEAVVFDHERGSGVYNVMRPIDDAGPIEQDKAGQMAWIAKFIRARETFDPAGLNDNYNMVLLFSTGQVSKDEITMFQNTATDPRKIYGEDTRITVQLKSFSWLNDHTVSVRFSTTTIVEGNPKKPEDWVANVRFKFTNTPEGLQDRIENPFGFQVYEYRKDQENFPQANVGG